MKKIYGLTNIEYYGIKWDTGVNEENWKEFDYFENRVIFERNTLVEVLTAGLGNKECYFPFNDISDNRNFLQEIKQYQYLTFIPESVANSKLLQVLLV
jgi:hypothetical protein